MADAYGTIIICGDYKADLDRLVDCMNEYQWSNDGSKFLLSDGKIWFDYYVQYPTVFPDYSVFFNEDGDEIDEPDEDTEFVETEERYIGLEVLATNISKHISAGYIELTAVSFEKNRAALFETLKINANGHAEARRQCRSIWGAETDETTSYKTPTKVTIATQAEP